MPAGTLKPPHRTAGARDAKSGILNATRKSRDCAESLSGGTDVPRYLGR